MKKLRVAVTGATGKVGSELVKGIIKEPDLKLCGAASLTCVGQDAGLAVGGGEAGVKVVSSLAEVFESASVDVVIDFTRAEAARENIRLALTRKVPVVVGTTGFTAGDLKEFEELAYRGGVGAAIISNFATGAMLMFRFAEMARKYFPKVEIIELHHETKIDSPSGTALRLGRRLEAAGGGPVKIQSLRLPGAVAHHEVVFGGPGQLLTIRHDSLSRESFVPGVLMAARKVGSLRGIVYDLEEIID